MRETSILWQTERRRINQLHAVQGQRCFYCKTTITMVKRSTDPRCATLDHFFPLALEGRDDFSNMVLACMRCNQRKADRMPTLPELVKWNELAQKWPHIRPVSLDLYGRKLCVRCGGPIALERQLQSIQCGCETQTCSYTCSRAMKRRRQISAVREDAD